MYIRMHAHTEQAHNGSTRIQVETKSLTQSKVEHKSWCGECPLMTSKSKLKGPMICVWFGVLQPVTCPATAGIGY